MTATISTATATGRPSGSGGVAGSRRRPLRITSPRRLPAWILAHLALLLVVLVALVGGLWPALFAAVLSGLTLDYFFVDPLYTVSVDEPLHELALALYVLNAVLVSAVVDRAARRSRAAKRSGAEAELLAGRRRDVDITPGPADPPSAASGSGGWIASGGRHLTRGCGRCRPCRARCSEHRARAMRSTRCPCARCRWRRR